MSATMIGALQLTGTWLVVLAIYILILNRTKA